MNRLISLLVLVSLLPIVGCGGGSSGSGNQQQTTTIPPLPGQFAFLQQLPNGNFKPLSATPLIGTFRSDGAFSVTNINDPVTGQPLDMPIASLFLSSDGKNIVFEILTVAIDSSGNYFPTGSNIATANSDGIGLAMLTSSAPSEYYRSPQFSPDGKRIAFVHQLFSSTFELRLMNADGSGQTAPLLFSVDGLGNPSFSSDGGNMVVDIINDVADSLSQGIFQVKIDASSSSELTNAFASPCGQSAFDEAPSFTSNGKQISFSRSCGASSGLYIMNQEGSNLAKLQGNETPNVVLFQPRAVGNRLVFSSNLDHPNTNVFELYSIMPHGSNFTRLTNDSVYDGLSTQWMNFFPR